MSSVNFFCDLAGPATPLRHFWEHTVGSDHAPVALRADWQAQLRRCRDELGFRHVRFHGLLSDDAGTLVRHKEKLLYSFFNADQIFDFLLSIGMRPFVELSFMPKALASGHKTVFNYEANVTPPRDSATEVERLQEASRVWKEPHPWEYADGNLYLDLTLPPHAVAALTVEFAPEPVDVGGARA